MPPESDPDLLVLHGLRLKPFVATDPLAGLLRLSVDDVSTRLDAFASKGWVRHRDAAPQGWSLTPAGRAEAARRVTDEVAASGHRPLVTAAYESFRALNGRFLQVCTDWQLRPTPAGGTVTNDHADPDHDHRAIAELRAIDAEIRLVCADLCAALARFGGYGERFGHALRHVEAGETDWFTRPLIDSYHTVWFELHEDLLVSLGLERSSEAPT